MSIAEIYDGFRLDIWLASAGIIVGIGGFALALIQLKRVRRTSDQVREQVMVLQSRLSHASAVESLASALAIMDDIRRLHRGDSLLAILPDRYLALVRLLTEVQCAEVLNVEQKSAVQQALSLFKRSAELIEVELQRGKRQDSGRYTSVLITQYEKLATLLAELKKEMGGA